MSGTDIADWTSGEEAIVYQSCAACGSLQYFRRSFCATCGAPDLVDRRASGEAFDDPVARGVLFATLRDAIDPARIELVEVDAHINDAHFADLAADRLWALMAQRGSGR